MNPIFQVVVNMMLTFKRTCPKCKRAQIVPAERKKEAVRCKYCGELIPPKKNHI